MFLYLILIITCWGDCLQSSNANLAFHHGVVLPFSTSSSSSLADPKNTKDYTLTTYFHNYDNNNKKLEVPRHYVSNKPRVRLPLKTLKNTKQRRPQQQRVKNNKLRPSSSNKNLATSFYFPLITPKKTKDFQKPVDRLKTREKLRQSFPVDESQYKSEEPEKTKTGDYEDGIEVFHSQKNYFKDKFKPENHANHGKITQINIKKQINHKNHNDGHENNDNDDDDEEDENKNEESEDSSFTPIRMYAQVRKHEDSEHLPASILEPRLRKITKDTKIHTVYMEEGYEDGAYDHEGEEKEAEENEGYADNPKKKYRWKRSAEIPEINVSKDFLDKPTQFSKGLIQKVVNKYPYYNIHGVHDNSPLRYAQNLEHIPQKQFGNNLAFYEQSKNIICNEVPSNVNPVPEILDSGGNPTKESEKPELPRLKNLGDKIDCFKVKYFGEDPLDNPLFKEEIIESPKDIFKEFNQQIHVFQRQKEESFKEQKEQNLKEPKGENLKEQKEKNLKEQKEEYLNVQKEESLKEQKEEYLKEQKESLKKEKVTTPSIVTKNKTYNRLGKAIKINNWIPIHENEGTEIVTASPTIIDDLIPITQPTNEENEEEITKEIEENSEELPEAEALRMRNRRRRPYKRPLIYKPYKNYYDINLPYLKQQVLEQVSYYTTIRPNLAENSISEVYYKTQINPSEQLNVFSDVINHIQNSTKFQEQLKEQQFQQQRQQQLQQQQDMSMSSSSDNLKRVTNKRRRLRKPSSTIVHMIPKPKNRYKYKTFQHLQHETKKKPRPYFYEHSYSLINANEEVTGTVLPSELVDSTFHQGNLDNLGNLGNSDNFGNLDNLEKSESSQLYSTIDIPLNKFLVPGMKPPLTYEKPLLYSDFVNNNALKRRDWLTNHRLIRKKRNSRIAYKEIRRNPQSGNGKKAPEVEEDKIEDDDEDDYVPHRHTSYHYDPETDRIIYDKTTPKQELAEFYEEEEEEEEPQKQTSTTKKPKTKPKTVYLKDVQNPENGPTLVDFLKKLKSDPNYVEIKDPEPTEKPTTNTTEKSINASTNAPPEFLKFLDKLHSNSEYKKIDDEDIKTQKTTKKPQIEEVTEKIIEEEDDDDDDVPPRIVQNSPGGQFAPKIDTTPGIFDINDYLPKTKNYAPRTSIDYSKYKTIERTTPRHSISSKYNEEDDELPLKTNFRPNQGFQQVQNENANSAKQEQEKTRFEENEEREEKKEPITTTTEIPTTKLVRIRGRKRPTTTKRPTQPTPSAKPQRTRSTLASTIEPSSTSTSASSFTHRPAQRIYPRRPRPKIRLRPSSASTSEIPEVHQAEESATQKIRRIQRKSPLNVPPNHKPFYTPIKATMDDRMDDLTRGIILLKRQPRLVTPDILRFNSTENKSMQKVEVKAGEINPRRLLFGTRSKHSILLTSKNSRRNPDGIVENSTVTKIVRDPTKRQYFYAPLLN